MVGIPSIRAAWPFLSLFAGAFLIIVVLMCCLPKKCWRKLTGSPSNSASTGIGAHTAEYLARYKASLVLVARSSGKLAEVKAKCVAQGASEDTIHTVAGSVADPEDIGQIVQSTVEKFGRVDHLINNAACLAFEDIQHTSVETFDTVMNTNLRAPVLLAKEAMPHLKKTKGSVVNVSSVNSQLAEYNCAAYCISKAALEHFTRILALEVASDGVRVNSVVPGFVVTDTMLLDFPDDKKAEMEEKIIGFGLKSQPLGGGLRMSAVAKTIHFLVSDLAQAVTGESLRVDNGYHLALPPGMDHSRLQNSGLYKPEPVQNRIGKGEK